jgi:hypothetical protein
MSFHWLVTTSQSISEQQRVYASIKRSLIRNLQLNRAALLLVPPPPLQRQQRQQQHAAISMMLKIAHKAITKLAKVLNAGASVIFKLFQVRPTLLKKRIKQPVADAAGNDSPRREH